MAQAGGVPRPGSPAYDSVSSTDDMVGALNRAVADVSYCTFTFGEPPCPSNGESRDHIAVDMDDGFVPWDTSHTNGWDYADASRTRIQLYGPPCDMLRNQPTAHTVTVIYHFLLP